MLFGELAPHFALIQTADAVVARVTAASAVWFN